MSLEYAILQSTNDVSLDLEINDYVEDGFAVDGELVVVALPVPWWRPLFDLVLGRCDRALFVQRMVKGKPDQSAD